MSKRASTLVNMLLTLVVITLISGFLLGYVNQITLAPKAKVAAERKIQALQAVLPPFDNDLMRDVVKFKSPDSADSIEIYKATQKGVIQGYAMMGTSEKGFSGTVKTMIGFKPDGSINNIVVLEQKETPGLGTKMKEAKFIKQFLGKNPATFNLKVKKDGGQVDALTGATISTRAFSETVQSSFELLKNQTEGFKNK
ncbi:MAG: RnfABCDGE type electron transport complex subunit G [Flavobacteriaceae bacterium]|jgi:electron transport complex protein RnfG|nr:RnfABCDGE type electron transport complex subunit G [Flavobacteriaceae bacterium]